MYGLEHPERSQSERTRREDRHLKFYARWDNLLVCPEALNRATPRPGRDGGLYAFMRRVLESEAGHALYKQRQTMIEPVFAHIKHNRRADRFQRRGRAACRSEWRLITATHNLLKLHRHQTAPAAA